MKKSKSKKRHFFLGLGILFLLLTLAFIIFNIRDFLLQYANVHELNLNCNVPVLLRQDKQIIYDINFSKNYNELNYVKIKIVNKDSGAKEVIFRANDWIKLYFNKEDAVQLKFLPRLYVGKNNNGNNVAKHVNFEKRICFVINNIIYLTGVVPNSIIIRIPGQILVYPAKFKMYFLHGVAHKIKINTQDFVLEDGTKIKLYNFSNVFQKIRILERNDQIFDEGTSVEVLNATNKSGYATFWARVLQGLGFQVTHIYTINHLFDKIPNNTRYYIYINPKIEHSFSVRVIKELFKDNAYLTIKRPKGILTTSSIVVILVK